MKKKVVLSMVMVFVVASMLMMSCSGTAETTSTASSASQTTKTTAAIISTTAAPTSTQSTTSASNWWDEFGTPEYGGSMTVQVTALQGQSWDPAELRTAEYANCYLEPLFAYDWTLDRDVWSFEVGFIPTEYRAGLLAESWEQENPTTVKVKIRKGINWQNIAPVNGREFNAYDVEYSYARLLGTGEFTEANPYYKGSLGNVASVVALDDYTVEFTMKKATSMAIFSLLDTPLMVAREVVEAYGSNPNDTKNAIGTGAWLLDDYQSNVSINFVRNPDYWGYDERYPENQLPYMDELKILVIADTSTAIAALRTGKIDTIPDLGNGGGISIQNAASLSKSNPDIQMSMMELPGYHLDMRVDKEPFTDIRVRKALQMAIDLDSIAKSHYLGMVDGTPVGMMSPIFSGYCYDYSQWSDDIKSVFTYNPEGAKALLAEAGYPDGFSTELVMSSNDDTALMEIVKAEFNEIGVDMTISQLDQSSYSAYVNAGKEEQMSLGSWAGATQDPGWALNLRHSSYSGGKNHTFNNDASYDAMVDAFLAASTLDEAKVLSTAADKYVTEHFWSVNLCTYSIAVVWQPWIKGYSGEKTANRMAGWMRAHLWVNQDLKTSMTE